MWEGWKLGVKEVEKEGVGNGEIIGEYGFQKLCYFFYKAERCIQVEIKRCGAFYVLSPQ